MTSPISQSDANSFGRGFVRGAVDEINIPAIVNFFAQKVLPMYAAMCWARLGSKVLGDASKVVKEVILIKFRPDRSKLALRETTLPSGLSSACSALWKKIMGRKEAKIVEPTFNPELTKKFAKFSKSIKATEKNHGFFQNLLLYGPPGVGKTFMCEKLARDANINFIMMSGGDLVQYIKEGTHVNELRKLFKQAEWNLRPTMLFIDEAEGFCLDRNLSQNSERTELLTAFLNLTGTDSKKIILVLATNRKDDLDEAVLSRMDYKIAVGYPELSERAQIITESLPQFFDDVIIKKFFTQQVIDKIAKDTQGFSGRTLFKLMKDILAAKTTSDDNALTATMIEQTVADFVTQESVDRKEQAIRRMTRGPGASVKGHGTAPAA